VFTIDIEDTDLLPREGFERRIAFGYREPAKVRYHIRFHPHFKIIANQQGDIAKRMVLTLACGSEIADPAPSLPQTIARGLRQIIILLLINLNQPVSQRITYRVAITYYDSIMV
jgi:hypothetical protein